MMTAGPAPKEPPRFDPATWVTQAKNLAHGDADSITIIVALFLVITWLLIRSPWGRVLKGIREDEDAVRTVAAKLLRARGYEVIEAGSGEEALELAEQHAGQIDLMISDVVMPGMQGPDLLKHARAYLAGAPVMFISGYAEAEFSNLLEGEENISFLPKPIDIKTLAERVKQELHAG